MLKAPLPRLDKKAEDLRHELRQYCRLNPGEIWHDPQGRHTVACGDACDSTLIGRLFRGKRAALAVQDPPYNLVMFERQSVASFVDWCRVWVDNTWKILADDGALYVWLGADQTDHFQPLPQFLAMMAETRFTSRSFVTMRNQRGYGTQKNWMAVRQELLYYTKGDPEFEVQYTEIPKTVRGYYKEIDGVLTENGERGKSPTIRPGNVWIDIQQVFYRMEENVSGCYGQKPLKALERIIAASSRDGETVTDFFSHSGSTLLACERTGRKCITLDIDPIFAEISIRRLERFRRTGKTGWQAGNPFQEELKGHPKLLVKS
ncbi:MAG TPA: site-specific DNA-methyltransferase [candidate division Zixibacteria bacterium]|nr:site-specific DNA-methyltransferase [candidate division Zixibacteria bacterium]